MKDDAHDRSQRDEELAALLNQLTEPRSKTRPSLETLTAEYPHLADELRELWGTVMVVDAVAQRPHPIDSTIGFPSPAAEIRPPRQLGDFELGDEIGRGGMGVVYRARQQSLGRDVAVKLILRGAQASSDEQARFQVEAAAAAQLDHPHIVPIYDVGSAEGFQYFGMKLIEGQTLATKMAAGPLPEREAVQLMISVARAIEYAHQAGVVHRDLKPANILLDRYGQPHVSDFGLAKQATTTVSLTQTGAILGTPAYMAPEQAASGRGLVGPLSDVYGLGAILYALLTGRPPLQGASPVDTVLMVLEQDPLPPRLLNPRVSRDLEMIVLHCLQKPPELRYASAGELADDLQAFLAGEPISARSGQFTHIVARVFRETPHASVLENWGLLWMWHAAVLLVLCLVTNWLHVRRDVWPATGTPWPYLAVWGGGLAVWAPIFWALRRRTGPVTAVERHIAHAWGGSIVAVVLLFVVESLLGLPVLTLSPVLGLISGMVFVVKAGILAGAFYLQAAAMFLMAIAMAMMQHAGWPYGISLYGLVSAASFLLPGWKYYRQNRLKS
ncbi:MAG: serine/threonine protein kinase [Planctomycetales bacterium]|nr:serine/threonine protein kinase [Planctomycetales bacterium]